ncbi:hypothetical protein ACFVGM_27615 [Kitasatospora purpeofusca]
MPTAALLLAVLAVPAVPATVPGDSSPVPAAAAPEQAVPAAVR